MVLEFRKVNPETDFPALARCFFESYEDPPQKFFHAWFPIHGDGTEAREAAIAEAATRLRTWQAQDPTMHWHQVIDTDTGRVAGGALWNVHTENPFASEEHMEASWFPDDGSRRYVEQVLEQHGAPRARVGQRPQVYLFIIFTHADYRRKGVAQQFMNWGIAKADELGVEMFLDSTEIGRPFYEANGFIYVEKNVIRPQTDTPDEAWKETVKKAGDHSDWWLMWRPVGGKYEEGTPKPWEKS
ncbi:uncharacterized protein F4822DRAFT_316442 [Hypoxylon trugodes]|uniref:uncharacterized protein n=1 Tax=Hypoxylon trugodes TaxID=326681 RepID=UPI00218D854B|nr:uncharacterized protein F4822DRAFT_316442 [Hypoxylon trugodes]KAI1386436.1 hypothetical protein F4822DRAFT_316442 [Hypoxylon trugodes]